MKLKNATLLLSASLLLFAACERDEAELDQAEASQALNEAETNAYYDELDVLSAEVVAQAEAGRIDGTSGVIPGCATVTHNPDTRTSTLDFGEACSDAAGTVRSGQIIITRSGRIIEPGSSITVTLADYTVNGVQVAGTRVVSNVSDAGSALPKFSVVVREGKVSWPDGTFAEREVNHLRSWIRASTPANDEWHIEGTANGVNRQGQAYTSTIGSALVMKVACRAEGVFIPVQGEQTITRPDKVAVALNYGNGSCDNDVVISANGRSKTITVTRK